jgi:hypothetical protein
MPEVINSCLMHCINEGYLDTVQDKQADIDVHMQTDYFFNEESLNKLKELEKFLSLFQK